MGRGGCGGRAGPPQGPARPRRPAQAEHDSCRVGSLAVSEPVTVDADLGGGAPLVQRRQQPRRRHRLRRLRAGAGARARPALDPQHHRPGPGRDAARHARPPRRLPVLRRRRGRAGRARRPRAARRVPPAGARALRRRRRLAPRRPARGPRRLPPLLRRPRPGGRRRATGGACSPSDDWLQRRTKYGDLERRRACGGARRARGGRRRPGPRHPSRSPLGGGRPRVRRASPPSSTDVREEYFTVLGHILDSRYYRTHAEPGAPEGKYSPKRRGYVVSMGEDLGRGQDLGLDAHDPRVLRLRPLLGGLPRRRAARRGRGHGAGPDRRVAGPPRPRLGHAPPLPDQLAGDRRRGPRQPGRRAPVQGLQRAAHAQRRAGRRRLDLAVPARVRLRARRRVDGRGLRRSTRATRSTTARRSPTPSTPPTSSTSRAACSASRPRRRRRSSRRSPASTSRRWTRSAGASSSCSRSTTCSSRRRGRTSSPSSSRGRRTSAGGPAGGAAGPPAARRVGFRENMDIKFLRPHELVVSVDTGPGGVHAVANGSEAKIADSMLRVLHDQGVLKDAGHDLRFNMRPGGNPGRGEFGGVVEAFLHAGSGRASSSSTASASRSPVPRAGAKTDLGAAPDEIARRRRVARLTCAAALEADGGRAAGRRRRRRAAASSAPTTRCRAPPRASSRPRSSASRRCRATTTGYLVEVALPGFGRQGDAARARGPARPHRAAQAGRLLRPRRQGALGSRVRDRRRPSRRRLVRGRRLPPARRRAAAARGAVPRRDRAARARRGVRRARPPAAPRRRGGPAAPAAGVWGRLTLATRDDLVAPLDAARDVLVVDLAGFESEAFGPTCASTFLADAVRLGWRNLVGYGCVGGPRYLGVNLADADGASARGVTLELYGREVGDFLGALLEGADIRLYGQGQCHVGMKAASGYVFVLQDALNTCCYAAHGGTLQRLGLGLALRRRRPEQGLRGRRRDARPGLQVDPLRHAQRVRLRVPHVGRRELAARGDGPRTSPTRAAS